MIVLILWVSVALTFFYTFSGSRRVTMQVLELLAEDLLLIVDAVSEDVWEDTTLFALELVRL